MDDQDNPLDSLYDLGEEERAYLENPDSYDFRSNPVIQEMVNIQFEGKPYEFKVDIPNQIITLSTNQYRAEYSLIEQGEEYSLVESAEHVQTYRAKPDETAVYYLVTEETYKYSVNGLEPTPIRVPDVFEHIELDEVVEQAKNSPSERRPLKSEREVDVPEVDTIGRDLSEERLQD